MQGSPARLPGMEWSAALGTAVAAFAATNIDDIFVPFVLIALGAYILRA